MFIRDTEIVNTFVPAEVEKPLSRKHLSRDGAPAKSVRLDRYRNPDKSDEKRQDRRSHDPRIFALKA